MNRGLEHLADSQKSRNCDGATRLNLLPVSSRKTERDHVLLTVTVLLAQSTDALPQRFEKLLFVYHAAVCTVARAETPRAD